jgi:uncharacterized short protein YbdD (DUF466 family)
LTMTLCSGMRLLRWYVRELFGETAYDHYLNQCEGAYPGEPVLSRREFEDRRPKPSVRCCWCPVPEVI